MIKKHHLCFTLSAVIIYFTGGTPNPAIATSHPLWGNGTHVCGAVDDQWNKRYSDQYPNRRYARSLAANLNVGNPRTVRLIYFLPNDRAYRADVVQRLKDDTVTVKTLYAEWMGAHGYGDATFRVETDFQDEPMVHDVIGKHPHSYYLDRTFDTVYPEIEERFDLNANVYLTVIDNGIDTISYSGGRAAGGRGAWLGKSSGFALFPSEFTGDAIAHELGHAFGLWHDFNDPRYIMSYGRGRDRLSACHAGYLSEHPYFNSDTPIEEERVPTIELISPSLYPAGSNRVSVRLKVSDPEGLHQVLLFATTIEPHFAAGFLELKACRQLGGEKDTIVEFDYDGAIPSDGFTNLSDPAGHPITIEAVDTDGNVGGTSFTLAEISPHHITSLHEHTAPVQSVQLSPDGRTLASGSTDGTVKLWDVATGQSVTTLDEHTDVVRSVSFSMDGTLASGSWDGTVKLWDVGTQTNIGTLPHGAQVLSVSFSKDGTLAAGLWNGTVELWDVETQTNIGTLPHGAQVLSVSFSKDGTLAVGLWNGTVELWDVETQTSIGTLLLRSRIFSVSFSPNGAILAAGLWNGTVELWDVETQTNIGILPQGAQVLSVSFSTDGTLASGAYDGTVKLWEATTRINFATLWHSSPVYSVSSSSTILASGTGEGTIELWDTSEWRQLRLEAMVEVHIPDRNLRASIEQTLNKAPGDTISTLDMESLTRLEASEAGIMNLTGLEAATNLRILHLYRNSISDISVVADLTKLTELFIGANNISNISAVSGLTRLSGLGLGSNSITDIAAASGLTNLTELYLGNNAITDISALSGLTRLTVLHLWHNSITDISALSGLTNLTELHLENNSITDIAAVSGLTDLTKLSIWGNSISDISPLVANTGLGRGDEILMQRNPLSYLSIHTHIPALRTRMVTVEFDNQAHSAFSKVSGDNQQGMPNETLADPFVVQARDANGFPLVGVSVTFTVVKGDGTLSVTNTTTDGNGRAQTLLTLGPNLGTNTVEVSVAGISHTAVFSAETTPPLPTTLEYVSGENQSSLTGETLPKPFVVEVRDVDDNLLEGVVVRFAVTAGGGSLSSEMVMTNENGQAESTLTLGSEPGTNTVEASVEGIPHIAVFNIVSGDNQTGPTGEVPVSMYWLERGEASGIRRATPDDTGINSVVTRGLQQPAELAVDVVNRKVYWTDIKAKAIRRANLDGTGVQDIVTVGLNTPNGVALDVTGGMVYWTDWGTKKIQRANFDGTGVQDLVTNRHSLLGGIALDMAGGTMYWVDFGRDTIWRANLDGTEVEALVTAGLSIPFAIALDVAGGKMYWADKGTHKIQRANLDGTGVQDLLTEAQGIDNPNGIALDVASGTMYWTESSKGTGKIKSANLDGSNVQTLFADRDDPRSIALDIPLPPDAMPTAMSKPQPPSTPDAPAKPEDVNRDGVVDAKDILVVVQHFGKTGEHMADVNGDGVVNLADTAQVALALDDGAAAPLARGDVLDVITPERVRQWLTQAKLAGANQEAILALEQLLSLLTPKHTALHPNYPNPFNPETWIPYHLANDSYVWISIYDISGALVRQLDLGHQRPGDYTNRSRAAYWDGCNGFGERVASGVYFYTFTTDSFRSTRKMSIGK